MTAPGNAATVSAPFLPGETFRGRIDFVYPTLTEDTQTIKLRIVVPNHKRVAQARDVRPRVAFRQVGKALAIPRSALIQTGERQIAFVEQSARHLRAPGGEDRRAGKGLRRDPRGPLGRRDGRHIGQLPDRLGVAHRSIGAAPQGSAGQPAQSLGKKTDTGRTEAMIEKLIAALRPKQVPDPDLRSRAVRRRPMGASPHSARRACRIYRTRRSSSTRTGKGRTPNLIEDQVTYPIVSALISAPKVKTVRGYSFFGYSYVYVIFDDGTDLYWARSRVLEYLNGLRGRLPEGVNPNLGPDATGVGWGFEYALVDKTGRHSLADLRTFQDWDLSYWLRSVPGVAEVSSVGGFQKQYQIEVDPVKLASYGVGLHDVLTAVQESNGDVGGRVVEWTGREYMVRGPRLHSILDDLRKVPLKARVATGTPVYLSDVANIHFGPEMRRGVTDWNGEGEAVSGVVIVRSGENVLSVVDAVKKKIADLSPSFPPGIELKVAYDRTELIHRAIDTLKRTLIEEMIVVALVILVFLFHFRSALVPIAVLPAAIVISFLPMYLLRVSSNIMSLGGLALAIGVLVDASIVMVENAHRHLAAADSSQGGAGRESAILAASRQMGRPIFFSLVIIVVSFLPVFLLTGEEGRLFHPLAFTKTFSIAAASILSVTLVPILMVAWMRGRIRSEEENPVAMFFRRLYAPVLSRALRFPKTTLMLNFLLVPAVIPLALSLGSEFMPQLREGSLMYMPTGLPMMSMEQARDVLVKTDGIIMTFPQVRSVLGKAGKFESRPTPPRSRCSRRRSFSSRGRSGRGRFTGAGTPGGRGGSSRCCGRSGPRCESRRKTS